MRRPGERDSGTGNRMCKGTPARGTAQDATLTVALLTSILLTPPNAKFTKMYYSPAATCSKPTCHQPSLRKESFHLKSYCHCPKSENQFLIWNHPTSHTLPWHCKPSKTSIWLVDEFSACILFFFFSPLKSAFILHKTVKLHTLFPKVHILSGCLALLPVKFRYWYLTNLKEDNRKRSVRT